jgi:hypothetical protein
MGNANLLHKNKFNEFRKWLEDRGEVLMQPKGSFEVLRWKGKKGRNMPIIFSRIEYPEHYSCNAEAAKYVRSWLRSKKEN